ncbi:PQQ-dependent sugar dehydrogenase [Halovivax cerinus]|uniref:PQQ-dependent sugar dehydrogenase n=1 Tax=Halovivax cerinus TaxID=1487865 RepID=A0ABD5NLG7_9EURY|nr:PQQ-dependent sugar dehydrogenase [Halovivax cerinus]
MVSSTRRRFLEGATVGTSAGLVGCLGWSAPGPAAGDATTSHLPASVGLRTVVSGLDAPIAVSFLPDSDRRYVAERDGRVLLHGPEGVRDDPVLDLRETTDTDGEKGVLGLALAPSFAESRRLFVRYSGPLRDGMPDDYSHTFVLSEFPVTDDGTRARRDEERRLLEIPEPRDLHNGGDIAFGPDGYLYVTVGDSGASTDASWHDRRGGAPGQAVTDDLLGSVLRIDVDGATAGDVSSDAGGGSGADGASDFDGRGDRHGGGDHADRSHGHRSGDYAIPEDNPLVGREGFDEHYAWGFRNPWRLSFDGEDLYVADVGQASYEEVNLVEKGGNYGWNVTEGTHCFKADDYPDATPERVRGGEPLLDPIIEYPHEGGPVSGVAVVGGYVYRGSTIPELDGHFVFGDFIPKGRVFVATRPEDGEGLWETTAIDLATPEKLTRALSFGRDGEGAVYVLGTGSEGGGLFRLEPDE